MINGYNSADFTFFAAYFTKKEKIETTIKKRVSSFPRVGIAMMRKGGNLFEKKVGTM